jgi:hypothetical protein
VPRESGLVSERRQGTWRFYRAAPEALGGMRDFVRQFWEQDIDRLAELAERETYERKRRALTLPELKMSAMYLGRLTALLGGVEKSWLLM